MVFEDIEIFYWTVNGDIGWFGCESINQLLDVKIEGGIMPGKSRTARFVKCGNYRSIRKNPCIMWEPIIKQKKIKTYTY